MIAAFSMRALFGLLATAGLVITALVLFAISRRPPSHTLHLKAYFADAGGLRSGGNVKVAGVQVGKITDVRVRTDLPQNPAEVTMLLDTPYDLNLPSDALVSVETAGIFGEPFAEIEIGAARGQPVSDNATLKTVVPKGPTTRDILNCLSNLSEHKRCDLSNTRQTSTSQEQQAH